MILQSFFGIFGNIVKHPGQFFNVDMNQFFRNDFPISLLCRNSERAVQAAAGIFFKTSLADALRGRILVLPLEKSRISVIMFMMDWISSCMIWEYS